ncbi:MAG: tRNA (adenosine(37)-N6)-threonylcarbamoyltransferase complex transferase subunit TsaD [Clostridia bacterium]|nr:tRNA (adenosine(37)-N6)-threonylcarbamoyltransferase complex transferase subunit TsaD [Clostridia bacterium]
MQPIILAIESSCDETAAAVSRGGREILSSIISTQIDIHKEYGGVVPEIASRHHLTNIDTVVKTAISESGLEMTDIDAVAVTAGPGLVGALLVGVSYAKALARSLCVPLVPVHHIEGHICANYIANPDLEPPFVCLVASGGHSHIVHVTDYGKFEILGRTRDDAAGEAFDKIARVIGLGYPGGPLVENAAKEGKSDAISFPRVRFENKMDFSFSGVKTAVMNYIHHAEQKNEKININDVAASFQEAVTDVLAENTIYAARLKNVKKICLAGGVASNGYLRKKMERLAKKDDISVLYPPPVLCTDNAAMICCAGYYEYKNGNIATDRLNAYPSLELGDKIVM